MIELFDVSVLDHTVTTLDHRWMFFFMEDESFFRIFSGLPDVAKPIGGCQNNWSLDFELL